MNSIEAYLVTREQAQDLKKLGFDCPCISYYEGTDKYSALVKPFNYNRYNNNLISAPFKVQVFDWFRENYLYHCSIERSVSFYYGCITLPSVLDLQVFTDLYHDCGTVESECINKLIELAKQQKL
jgi:hypothetical protein